MKVRILLLLVLLAGSFSGCATVLRPLVPARQVGVTSTPEGAAVLLDGTLVGRTPCTIRVPQTSDGVVSLRLEGYEGRDVVLEKRTYWAFFLDLVPILFYAVALLIVHNNDTDVSWRDDFGKAAGFTFGAAAGAVVVDLATESHQIFPKRIPSIQVTLIKKEP